MTMPIRLTFAFALVSLSFVSAATAQHSAMPPGMTHEQHLAQMKKDAEMKPHGNIAMGFDQDKTTHHFTLTADGGTIAVTVNDAADVASRDQVQAHLREISQAFASGGFDKPLLTHGEMPPGATVMQHLKDQIQYLFESTGSGGRVRISTSNAEALNGVHEFLRYQIKEHATADSLTVQK